MCFDYWVALGVGDKSVIELRIVTLLQAGTVNSLLLCSVARTSAIYSIACEPLRQ